MSQISVPWTPRPEPRHGIIASMIVLLARAVYRIARPILSRFAGLLMLAATVAVCLLVWGHRLLFDFVDGLAVTPLSVRDLKVVLAERGYSSAWAMPLWPVQYGVTRDLIAVAAIAGFASIVAMFGIWWERKVAGRIQSRMGPMRVGGWHGWAQTPADGLKLITKEDLIPADADRILFRLAPYFAFVPPIVAYVALPFGAYYVCRDLDVGLIFILALLGIEVLGVILAGWASNNKWSVYGGMREACQMVSYEIPMGMALLIPIMCAGTLQLTSIGNLQDGGWFSWLAFRNPFTFLAAGGYFVASLASCKRAPFDLPESESELVGGFHTEYSGFRWSLFFFGEYSSMFIVSGILTILFLGAWYSPLPMSWAPTGDDLQSKAIRGLLFDGPLWFVAKCTFLLYVQMWIRWTLPRIRIDQVLYSCIQVMLPAVMVLLLGNTLWELVHSQQYPAFLLVERGLTWLFGTIGLLGVLAFIGIMLYGLTHQARLVGSQANRRPLAGG